MSAAGVAELVGMIFGSSVVVAALELLVTGVTISRLPELASTHCRHDDAAAVDCDAFASSQTPLICRL